MDIKRILINEPEEETIAFIESKRNWDVKRQCYRFPEENFRHIPISECDIFWRGEFLMIEYNGIIHYWEYSGRYCFLEQAINLFEINIPLKWKTMDKLISFRMAIRQTEVNLCGYVDKLLVGKRMSLKLYNQFMKVSRQQDLEHHGVRTF